MELVVLGSGTVAPTPHRAAPGYWVQTGDCRMILDCGGGYLHQAARYGVAWHDADAILISHFHPDHWADLPMILMAMSYGIDPGRTRPLALVGPQGLRARLTALSEVFGSWVLEPSYGVTVTELSPGHEFALTEHTTVQCTPTPHSEQSLAYAIEANGRRLVYTGDTGPSQHLGQWAFGCDMLLCECSLPEDRAIDVHLTPERAGQLAKIAQPKHLVLTHLYPPVEQVSIVDIVHEHFDGMVSLANDGARYTI